MELISRATSLPSPIFFNALLISTRARVDVAAESLPSARSMITLAQLDPYFRSLILAFTKMLLSRKYSTAGLPFFCQLLQLLGADGLPEEMPLSNQHCQR